MTLYAHLTTPHGTNLLKSDVPAGDYDLVTITNPATTLTAEVAAAYNGVSAYGIETDTDSYHEAWATSEVTVVPPAAGAAIYVGFGMNIFDDTASDLRQLGVKVDTFADPGDVVLRRRTAIPRTDAYLVDDAGANFSLAGLTQNVGTWYWMIYKMVRASAPGQYDGEFHLYQNNANEGSPDVSKVNWRNNLFMAPNQYDLHVGVMFASDETVWVDEIKVATTFAEVLAPSGARNRLPLLGVG